METYAPSERLNEAQLLLLKLFSRELPPETLKELKRLLVDFFDNLAQAEFEKLQQTKGITQADLDRLQEVHPKRTPYPFPTETSNYVEEPQVAYETASRAISSDWRQAIRTLIKQVTKGEPLPNPSAIQKSLRLGEVLQEYQLTPARITASAEGGVLWEFDIYGNYHLVEIFNDGDIVYLRRYPDGRRVAFDFTFEQLLQKITHLLHE